MPSYGRLRSRVLVLLSAYVLLAAFSPQGAIASAPPPDKWQPPAWSADLPGLPDEMRRAYQYEWAIGQMGERGADNPGVRQDAGKELFEFARGKFFRDGKAGQFGSGEYDADDAIYGNAVYPLVTTSTGVQGDIYVTPRHQKGEWFWVGMLNNNFNVGDGIAMEVTRQYENGNLRFRPLVHIKYAAGGTSDWIKIYDGGAGGQQSFMHAGRLVEWVHGPAIDVSQQQWHNIKIARNQSNGKWNVYLDATPLDYNLYWPTSWNSYHPHSGWEGQYETQYEAEPPYGSLAALGSHHDNLKLRMSNYSTWSYWTVGSWGSRHTIEFASIMETGEEIFLKYPASEQVYPEGTNNYLHWQAWYYLH